MCGWIGNSIPANLPVLATSLCTELVVSGPLRSEQNTNADVAESLFSFLSARNSSPSK